MYIEINRPLHPNNCQNIYQNGYHGVARRMPYEFVYLMIMNLIFIFLYKKHGTSDQALILMRWLIVQQFFLVTLCTSLTLGLDSWSYISVQISAHSYVQARAWHWATTEIKVHFLKHVTCLIKFARLAVTEGQWDSSFSVTMIQIF